MQWLFKKNSARLATAPLKSSSRKLTKNLFQNGFLYIFSFFLSVKIRNSLNVWSLYYYWLTHLCFATAGTAATPPLAALHSDFWVCTQPAWSSRKQHAVSLSCIVHNILTRCISLLYSTYYINTLYPSPVQYIIY